VTMCNVQRDTAYNFNFRGGPVTVRPPVITLTLTLGN
jgi:hypothetical protein